MDSESGGRVTLRRREGEEGSVEYEGELSAPSGNYRVIAHVALDGGAVRFDAGTDPPPEWLLEVARTTLRAAWHAHQSGVAWPRRLTRWRSEPAQKEPSQ